MIKIVSNFETVSLSNLQERAALLDRVDVKFAFTRSILDAVLQDCLEAYQILCITNDTVFDYETSYYDTENLLFYNQHHNGKQNRIKVRTRIYKNTQEKFLEVKKKTNKNKTIKWRLKTDYAFLENDFLKNKTGFQMTDLDETVSSKYSRITLLHKKTLEKVTFDFDLQFQNQNKEIFFGNVVIAEVKTEKSNISCFSKIMKKHQIRSGSLSKYCLGVLSVGNPKKYNNFKTSFLRFKNLNKI